MAVMLDLGIQGAQMLLVLLLAPLLTVLAGQAIFLMSPHSPSSTYRMPSVKPWAMMTRFPTLKRTSSLFSQPDRVVNDVRGS